MLIIDDIHLELTFIILANSFEKPCEDPECIRHSCPMIGDVNLFFNTIPSEEDHTVDTLEVEVEVMIAGMSSMLHAFGGT